MKWQSINNNCYCMASSPSGQNEPNRTLWLATRAGKMELPCTFIDQACSVKMARYWPRSFFYEFMDLESVSVHDTRKKNLPWPISSHLDLTLALRTITHLCRWWNSKASSGAEVQVTGRTGRRSQVIDQGYWRGNESQVTVENNCEFEVNSYLCRI